MNDIKKDAININIKRFNDIKFDKTATQIIMLNKLIDKLRLELELIDHPDDYNLKKELTDINKELYIYTPEPNEDEALDTIFGNGDDEALNAELIQRLKAQGIYDHQSE